VLLLNRGDIFVESKSEAYAELVLPSLAMVSWNYKDNLSLYEHRPTPPAASHGQEYLDGADMTVIVFHLIQKTNAMRDHLEVFSAEMSHIQRRLTILLHGGE